jgi:carboxyl-terminal processing protease
MAWLLGVAAIAVLGIAVTQSASMRDKDPDYELVRLMVDVIDEVDRKYVRELDPEAKRKLVEDMINGGLERLDPHSNFINAKRLKQFAKESKGEFGGVGIQVSTDSRGILQVISPLVGTPAYEAGVLAGDLIVKIDGKSTETITLSDAVEMIQGEPGQKVTLTVLHEGSKEPVDLEMVRAVIRVQSVMGDTRKAGHPEDWDFFIDPENKIAYVRLVNFSETTAKELRGTLNQLQQEGVRGLILDLRLNPGGLLKAAVEVTNLFLPEGRIVSTRGRTGQEEAYDADERRAVLGSAAECPMAILVNRFSASASEIVAAALQDHQRAVVIGERTFGKGSVQSVVKMEDGASAMKLTTGSYERPSGKNIHRFTDAKETDDWGVQPNNSGYLLTASSLASLKADDIPEEVISNLKPVLNRRYSTEKEYLDVLTKHLATAHFEKYKAKLLEHADRGFELPMKDEERLEYILYRRDRDIIHGKPGASPPPRPNIAHNKDKDKDKKPFEDRVLQKALDHLREDLKKRSTVRSAGAG